MTRDSFEPVQPAQEPGGLFERLSQGKTASGRLIILRSNSPENQFRYPLELLSMFAVGVLRRSKISERTIDHALERLRANRTNPIHYGENTPNLYFDGGEPVMPANEFSYDDLLSYGASGEGGFEKFVQITGMSPEIDVHTAFGLVAILLIESAVDDLESGDALRAAGKALRAADAFFEYSFETGVQHHLIQRAKAFASSGGIAAHGETAEYKAQVLAKWNTGCFNGNKSEAARWALREFPLKSQEVVRRWIRVHEEERASITTRQAEL